MNKGLFGLPKRPLSRLEHDPSAPPAVAGAIDDEFLTDGTTLPAGWVSVGPETPTYAVKNGSLLLSVTQSDADATSGMIERVLPAGPFSVIVHHTLFGLEADNQGGIYLRSSVSDRMVFLNMHLFTGSGTVDIRALRHTSKTAAPDTFFPQNVLQRSAFLRWSSDGANLQAHWSVDGTHWVLLFSQGSIGTWFTGGNLPDRVGLRVMARSPNVGTASAFRFFRYTPAALAEVGRTISVR